jgi:outer membrane protein assembly factor BamB
VYPDPSAEKEPKANGIKDRALPCPKAPWHFSVATKRLLAVAILVTIGFSIQVLAGRGPASARQVYGLMWMKQIGEWGPCLLTIALPAKEKERCLSWTRRESAGPAFHPQSGMIVVGSSDGNLYGVSVQDGKKVYTVGLPGALVSKPVLSGPRAFFGTNDGHVLRTDVTSGRVSWNVLVDAEVTEPIVVHDETILVVTGLDSVYALDRNTGETRWAHKTPLPQGITIRGQSRPFPAIFHHDEELVTRIFVGHASGVLVALDPLTGSVLYQKDLARAEAFNDIDADIVMQNGNLIVASQSTGIYALDPTNLTERWKMNEPGIVRLASAGNYMAVAAGAGNVIGFNTLTGAVRWRFTFEKGAPTRIVVKGGRAHVGSDRGPLYVLDLFTGEPLQYYGSALGIAADLEASGDLLFLSSAAGRLYALSNAFGGPTQQ